MLTASAILTTKRLRLQKDSEGEVEIVACANCNFFYLPKDDNLKMKTNKKTQHYRRGQTRPWTEHLKSGSESSFAYLHPSSKVHKPKEQPQHREVIRLTDLRPGDHIMWNRPKGYRHHAIVKDVLPDSGKISILHYNGPKPGDTKFIKGKILAEEIDPFAKGHRLFVAEYTNPRPLDEVLK